MGNNSITTVRFIGNSKRFFVIGDLWQHDYGQMLKIEGLDLPEVYEVHFSNTEEIGSTKTQIGTADGVTIPDEYLTSGEPVYVFIFLHDGETDGETEYKAKLPVRKRPKPSDVEPTPQEQSAITQAIAALNAAVSQTGQDAETTAEYTERAETAAEKAETSADRAEQAANTAGYMWLSIEGGHVIYERTTTVETDFSLENGHLFAEVI